MVYKFSLSKPVSPLVNVSNLIVWYVSRVVFLIAFSTTLFKIQLTASLNHCFPQFKVFGEVSFRRSWLLITEEASATNRGRQATETMCSTWTQIFRIVVAACGIKKAWNPVSYLRICWATAMMRWQSWVVQATGCLYQARCYLEVSGFCDLRCQTTLTAKWHQRLELFGINQTSQSTRWLKHIVLLYVEPSQSNVCACVHTHTHIHAYMHAQTHILTHATHARTDTQI